MQRVACFAGKPAPTFMAHALGLVVFSERPPVGAGLPANTGKAGAMQRVASATSSAHGPFQVRAGLSRKRMALARFSRIR
ncbi:hypothetical protein C4Q27_26640 [Pseudomonas sp. SWI36]|nr:hypothetical protein C4Q27_26640 [Pseudomonas sp. SWI36]